MATQPKCPAKKVSITIVALLLLSMGLTSTAQSQGQKLRVSVKGPDQKGVQALLQVVINGSWRDHTPTDAQGNTELTYKCGAGEKLRARPVNRKTFTMSLEELCTTTQRITLRVQVVRQEFANFGTKLQTQVAGINKHGAFGELPANLAKALENSNYALVAQSSFLIAKNVKQYDSNGVDWKDFELFANQAAAAELGFDPSTVVTATTEDVIIANSEYSETLNYIQSSAGIRITARLDTKTLQSMTGVEGWQLYNRPLDSE